jgi:hypothetical protein
MADIHCLICWGGTAGKAISSINTTSDELTITNHGLQTGVTGVRAEATSMPGGLSGGTTYYPRSTGANTFTLHPTAADANNNTNKLNITSAGSGVVLKSAYYLGLGDTSRWSGRIYDGLTAWRTDRITASAPYDTEIVEIGEAFDDRVASTLQLNLVRAQVIIAPEVNGIKTTAWHGGVIGAGYRTNVAVSFGIGVQFTGFRHRMRDVSVISSSNSTILARFDGMYNGLERCFVVGTVGQAQTGINSQGAANDILNNVVISCQNGIQPQTASTTGNLHANNLVAKCTTGFVGGSNIGGLYYNNMSVGNTTNWGSTTGITDAANNYGISTDAPWFKGTDTSRKTLTADNTTFVDYANNNFRPASATAPQVDTGITVVGIATLDLTSATKPSYNNGGAEAWDGGPFEFDNGFGAAPLSITVSNLQAGSTVRFFTAGTQTELASTTNSGTSYSPSIGGTVDYTIYKDGYLPIRGANVTLTDGLVIDGTQTLDRAYAASSGLTYGTTATVNTTTGRFGITTPTTGQNWYSFWIEQYRSNAALRNKPFPLAANGPNSFTLRLGYEFDGTSSIANLSRDGVRYLDNGGAQTAVWAAVLTVGVPSGCRVRFQQSDGGTTQQAAITSGNMDELVQVYGDGAHGNFDYRGYLRCKVQEQGYDQAEVDVVALYGNIEDQLYVIGLAPTANGVAAGNPDITGVTLTDHGASPVTWNGKSFSITITDAGTNSGSDIMRWLRYYFEQGGTFQGKDAFNWHDLVQTNGSAFKTVRGAIYGDTGAAIKGVRVLRGAAEHPDFTLHTADDGTTYAPVIPAAAAATVLADTRVQLYNVTAGAEIDNVFVAGTGYSKVITTEASAGDTLRLRVTKKGRQADEAFAVWTASGATFLVSQPEDAVYTAWGIDGEAVAEFALDVSGTVEIDANDVDGATQKTRLGAWYSYILTTADGIRHLFGAITFLSAAAIRVNVDVLDLKIENVNSTTALRFTDLDVRLYRSDGTSIIADASYSIHNDYSGVPDVVETGVSGLTGSESAQLMGLPSASAVASAVKQAAIEGDLTLEQAQRIILAALVGRTSGIGTAVETYLSQDGATERILASFDGDNNRTFVTLNGG